MDWRAEIRRELQRHNRRADDGVVEELAQHAEAASQAARADGASPDEAATRVRALIAAWCAATNGPRRPDRLPLVESAPASRSIWAGLGLDVRHAIRVVRRQPGFALVSIAMIALAIGATTTLFSVVNGVLLRPLPWPNASRLIRVSETREGSTSSLTGILINATYNNWANAPTTLDGIGAYSNQMVTIDSANGPERVLKTGITASLLPMLGVQPFVGSGFTSAHERDETYVLLSYSLWQSRFGGAADIVGKTMTVDRRPYTIVGVMPRGFEFPTRESQFWTPMLVAETKPMSINMFNALALLKPGVTIEQARAEGEARARSAPSLGGIIKMVFGVDGPAKVTAMSFADSITGDVKPALWVLLAAVGLLFAAAIGNVANMQLSQATGRRREVAIRAAIGAGSGRLARQLFVETAITSIVGGALGLALAAVLLKLLPALLPADFPRTNMVTIDAVVLAAVSGLTALVTVATGLLPVRLARSLAVRNVLAESGGGTTAASPAARSRSVIIATQVAIAAVLLVGAALLSRSFVALMNVDRGYEPSNLMTSRVLLPGTSTQPAARTEFFDTLAARLKAMPGVSHVGMTNSLPLTAGETLIGFSRHADAKPGDMDIVHASLRTVSADYLNTLGMHVVEGRGFTSADTLTSEPVMLVNRTFAAQNFKGPALDQVMPATLDGARESAVDWRIVGIVDDVRYKGATDPVQPEIYNCLCQSAAGPSTAQYVTVRTTRDAAALARGLRDLVRGINPAAIVEQTMTMEDRLATSLARPRLYAVLLGGFAVFALLISGIGLFGGLSYGVAQRTREIGVRSALGATPLEIVLLVARQGGAIVAAGLTAGFVTAYFAVRLLGKFLFGVTPYDAASFAGVAAVLVIVAVAACVLPARRATRVDVIRALRQ